MGQITIGNTGIIRADTPLSVSCEWDLSIGITGLEIYDTAGLRIQVSYDNDFLTPGHFTTAYAAYDGPASRYQLTTTTLGSFPYLNRGLYTLNLDGTILQFINEHCRNTAGYLKITPISLGGIDYGVATCRIYASETYTHPELSITSVSLSPNNNVLMKNYSTVTMVFYAKAAFNGEQLTNIRVNNIDMTPTAATSYTVIFSQYDNDTITISATDQYGLTSNVTYTFANSIDYQKCDLYIQAVRKHSSMDIVDVNLQASSTSDFGTLQPAFTFRYRYKVGSGDYGNWINVSNPNYNGDNRLQIPSVVSAGVLTIQAELTDGYTSDAETKEAAAIPPIFFLARESTTFTVPIKFDLDTTPIYINGTTLEDYIRSIN